MHYLLVCKKNEVCTLVHQHGYIANKASYFPINANHFLSWGTQALIMLGITDSKGR